MCLVAFGGTFRLATATRGWAPAPGPYRNAIVVVRQSTGKVVATVLFGRLPRGIHFFELSGLVRPKPSPDTDVGVVRPAGY
jgi:hypothetical protein